MPASKPEIVFIGGAWHYPESYAKFTTILESQQDLTVHVPQLTTMNGARPPTADLYTDTALIRQLVTELSDKSHTLIILMHSYGGQVGTNALAGLGVETRKKQGLPGGVVELVYICTHVLQEGQSVIGTMEQKGHAEYVPILFDFAEDGTCIPGDSKGMVGTGLSEEDLDVYLQGLGRWSGKAFYQPLEHCAWRDIPVSYIQTPPDALMPLAYQKAFVEDMEAAGRRVRVFELVTGHCPNITKPEELASIIQEIVGDVMG
ncbi:hypothetical protein N7456_008930 [Penicillium angulare]|uniref:AB hydrolase-1 domain-containing protein n=1 Tax=Penicillium angulare TaxID=116970 RepID=A0A9W9F3S9_9EURO|nr:hypothetical protein N7456_008930 [Penicillium angulare]